jgi:hypothetical protein
MGAEARNRHRHEGRQMILSVHRMLPNGHVTRTVEGGRTTSLVDPDSPAITSYRVQEYFQQRVRTLWCTPSGLAQLASRPF